jgi:alkanesulfonate monooxygenase
MQPGIEVFSTCPPSAGLEPSVFRRRVLDVARWSDRQGCRGMLVYTDNSLVDPWVVAQLVIEHTAALRPLVAVQPVYRHPYTVAKTVASLGHLWQRGVDLNMVAGGFVGDLRELADTTPHDRRYDRLREYGDIVRRLLHGQTVSRAGEFYRVDRLRLRPELPPALRPRCFVSGSSPAGRAAARALDAVAVEYPVPGADAEQVETGAGLSRGIRVGIVARADEDEAWRAARVRFPGDRAGRIAHLLAGRASDSQWHRDLSGIASEPAPYWLAPFRQYKTFCPYLVGTYARVGQELGRYVALGYTAFLLDVPADEEDLHHASLAFEHALAEVA